MDTVAHGYTRVLLKLSGEQLAGKFEGGIDAELCTWLAAEVKQVVDTGCQVVIMVGGGNYVRGAQLAGHGIGRVTADNMGMLATLMNAVALADIFNHAGVSARSISTVDAEQVVDPFTHRRAINHLQKNRVVIVGGGSGRPYVTTDTAAIMLALELECEIVLKATKVDGVYDKDPAKHPGARLLGAVTFQQAVADDAIRVMDKAALGLAMEHKLPIIIFDALHEGNLLRAASGTPSAAVGTRIDI